MTCSTAATLSNIMFDIYGERGFVVGEDTVRSGANGTVHLALDGAPAAERAVEFPEDSPKPPSSRCSATRSVTAELRELGTEAGLRAARMRDALRQARETGRRITVG